MKTLAAVTIGVAVFFSSASFAKFRPGDYTLTFYAGRKHAKSGSVCIQFVKTHATEFRNSGTWSSPDMEDWGGNYTVDGEYVRFYGTYPDNTGGYGVTNFYYHLGTGDVSGYDEWTFSSPPIQPLGEGIITLDHGCTPGRRHGRASIP